MSTKKAYLIERPLAPHEINGCLEQLQLQEAVVYLSTPHPALEEAGAVLYSGLNPIAKAKVTEQLLSTLNALGHQQLKKDTVAGHLYYKGFPTWYYHKFRINFILQQRLQQLETYRQLAAEHTQLVVYKSGQPPVSWSKELPTVQFVPGTSARPGTPVKGIKTQLSTMWERFKQGYKQRGLLQNEYPKHLFVLNHAHVRSLLNPEQLPEVYEDNVFVGYFLRNYAEEFLLLDKLLLDKTAGENQEETKGAYYQRPLLNNEWVEWTALFSPGVWWQLLRYNRQLKKAYYILQEQIKEPLQKQIIQEVVKLHRSSLFFFFIYQAYRWFFRRYSFSSVTVLDEYSPNFRAIIDAAKNEGVRTQAIQHGSLAALNPGYGYSSEDERFNPWPDRMLVWGAYWKELLTRIAAYPPERLFVTGQIRSDVIPVLQQTTLSAKSILGEELVGKFLILFATQPQPDEGIRIRAAQDMFAVAQELPNAWVLVKPHPREKDLSYYGRIAEEAGCSNYSFVYEQDLFLLLRLSHVLVHCYSTVGIEAVYFGVPAIILDYLKQDVLQFAAEEVALQAVNRQELKQLLSAIQEGKEGLDSHKRQAYIQKYACAIDGHVSERTAQALLVAEVSAD